jgi:hypothetical protein
MNQTELKRAPLKWAEWTAHEPDPNEPLVEVPVDFLGHKSTAMMRASQAKHYLRALKSGERLRERLRRHKAKASQAYREKPTARRRRALIDGIDAVTGYCNSHERAEIMLASLSGEGAEIFWPVFEIDWPACDASWRYSFWLLECLRRHAHCKLDYVSLECRAAYDALPDMVEVWRGTDRTRVRGVAWTTHRKVALGFATGMRGGAFPDPVIAHAFIPKQHVFIAYGSECEAEVVLDPRRLRKLTIEPFDGKELFAPCEQAAE